MPRATKDAKNVKEKKTAATKSTATKKKTTTPVKKSTAASKSTTAKKKTTTSTKKSTTASKSTATKKKTTTPAKKTATTSKPRAKSTKKSTVKKLESNIVAEYYDLPYRYNETIVKILYQTPTVLFVYWDIADSDRERFVNEYGENFFNETRPVLKIFNLTKNYSFEVEINDFANSWYIQVNDASCDYKVELARRKYNLDNHSSDYIYVSTSNQINFPNDHILLEELQDFVYFKNVKTNQKTLKDIRTLHLIGIQKIFNVNDFYKRFYKDEILEEINNRKLLNPSSLSSWS